MKKVANIVLNNFTNDSRVLKTSKSLLSLGFEVKVFAMHDVGLPQNDSVSGVNVNRIKLFTRSWPKKKLFQLIKYIEFSFKCVARCKNLDILHCNDLNALPIGVLASFFNRKIKIVYDCHEYETETHGLSGIIKKLLKYLERSLISRASQVITVSESISNAYSKEYGIKKTSVILNCPKYEEIGDFDIFRKTWGIRKDQRIFLYQGRLSKGRGLEILLDAFSKFQSDQNVLVVMGYGPLQSLIQDKAEENQLIYFHPAVAPDDVLSYTGSADFGISFIEDACLNYRYCLPNKLFEYLMAGVPVLVSNVPEMRQLVRSEGVGVVAQDNSEEGVRRAVEELGRHDLLKLKYKVREARKKYSWEAQECKLRDIYLKDLAF